MKKTIRKNINDLPYSLHDARICGFQVKEDTLTMVFENGFVRCGDPCMQVEGTVKFTGINWDFCWAYVFDSLGEEGPFTGKKLLLKEFAEGFHDCRLDVCDENYGYNQSKFAGFLAVDEDLKECAFEIYHFGDMTYETEE